MNRARDMIDAASKTPRKNEDCTGYAKRARIKEYIQEAQQVARLSRIPRGWLHGSAVPTLLRAIAARYGSEQEILSACTSNGGFLA